MTLMQIPSASLKKCPRSSDSWAKNQSGIGLISLHVLSKPGTMHACLACDFISGIHTERSWPDRLRDTQDTETR
jgi:hypothetical protein